MIQWARKLMGDHEIVEMRHPARSSDEDREETLRALAAGRRGVRHRPPPAGPQLAARRGRRLLGLPAVVLLRDLGPPDQVGRRDHTPAPASRTPSGRRACASSATSSAPRSGPATSRSATFNAEPEALFDGRARTASPRSRASTSRSPSPRPPSSWSGWSPTTSPPAKGRENWAVDGILCYSKICTHVGCPISLYERTTHHLLCPCHQSTFDLADAGKVVFGPAARPLPQLPMAVDDEGYLVAQSDFTEPVGPSFWERG